MEQRPSATQVTVTLWKIGRKSFTRDSELIYTYAPVYVTIKGRTVENLKHKHAVT